jgi:hypothetical protein
MIPKPEPSTSIAALIAMKYWMPSRTKQSAGMSSIRLTSAKPQSQNSNQPTTMKYYVFLIAMKDINGDIYPHEVAAPSISDAIEFLTNDTGMTYAYEIKPL